MKTPTVMRWVLAALLPGYLTQIYFFGWGYGVSMLLLLLTAVLVEAGVLAIRKRPVLETLKDSSALVTAALLAIALPPFLPWWMYVMAGSVAVLFGKQLYGGLGFNPFNPAMIAYALLLVSYPVAMSTSWALPLGLAEPADILTASRIIFLGDPLLQLDALSGATPLDTYKSLAGVELSDGIWQKPIFGEHVALGWEWVAMAFGIGGGLLLLKRIITWHIPVCVLLGLSVMAMLFGWDPDRSVPIHLHWLGGSLIVGAFFIATDPVSAPTTTLGKCWFGIGVGVLVYVIRAWGNNPDAVAFAVLLMNFTAPLLDQITQPKTFGHQKPNRTLIKVQVK